jgi:hypothetical protein
MAKPQRAAVRLIGNLVDELGAVRAQLAALKTRETELRDAIMAHRVGEAEGARYSMALASSVRWSLDVNAVRLEMGEDWFDRRCRQTAVVSIRIIPRATPEPMAEAA